MVQSGKGESSSRLVYSATNPGHRTITLEPVSDYTPWNDDWNADFGCYCCKADYGIVGLESPFTRLDGRQAWRWSEDSKSKVPTQHCMMAMKTGPNNPLDFLPRLIAGVVNWATWGAPCSLLCSMKKVVRGGVDGETLLPVFDNKYAYTRWNERKFE